MKTVNALWEQADQQANQQNFSAAEATLIRIKKAAGNSEKVVFFLGEMCRLQGKLKPAFEHYQHAIKLSPKAYPARHALATLCLQGQAYAAAFDALKPVLASEPSTLNLMVDVINHAWQAGVANVAEYCQQALAILPKAFQLYFLLGEIYRTRGHYDAAVKAYEQTLACNEQCTQAMNNLAIVCQQQGFLKKAEHYYLQALAVEPDSINFMVNLAGVYIGQKNLADAVMFLRGKLKKNPDSSALKGCLARALQDMGEHEEALVHYQASLERFEAQAASALEYSQYHGSYLSFLNYPNLSKDDVYQAHVAWARVHASNVEKMPATYAWRYAPSTPESEGSHQRLRIGYVSADLRQHSVAYFLLPLLAQHNKNNVSVTCYMNSFNQDSMTKTLQGYSDDWRLIAEQSTAQVAAQIRADQIDVLIDLSGHTAGSRLDVFALKPAPVQMTWLGYPNTTGLQCMDYRITDAWADPKGEERWHSETLIRLPQGFLCYQPPDHVPEVSPLPLLENQYVTYGSFNNLAKHNDQVIALWSRLLLANPNSRLLIKNTALSDKQTARVLKQRFAKQGVSSDRLELLGYLPDKGAHLALYSRIDVALDTFPYNGTTTSCEALWMGIPLITLAGDRHAGRVGMSLLNQIGHAEWIAKGHDEYIEKALTLGKKPRALSLIRENLRQDMQHSSLSNAAAFAQGFEAALIKARRVFEKEFSQVSQG